MIRAMSQPAARSPKPLHIYIAEFRSFRKAAEVLGVTERCARSWRYRERQPRTKDIPRLIRNSGGALSLDSFFPDEETTHD